MVINKCILVTKGLNMFSSWQRKLSFTLYFGVKLFPDICFRVKFVTNSMSDSKPLQYSTVKKIIVQYSTLVFVGLQPTLLMAA